MQNYPETRKAQKIQVCTTRPKHTKKGYKVHYTFKTVKKPVLVEYERSTTIGGCGEFGDQYVTVHYEVGTVELDGKTYSISKKLQDDSWGTIQIEAPYNSPF